MNEFFGISMTYIMIALLTLLAVAIGSVGWVLVRNRIMFLVGVRNIPRRRAQTVLIVIGLMLSTLIIATAFSIGDTVEYSITNTTYDRLSSIDEIAQAQAEPDGESGADHEDPFANNESLISVLTIPAATARDLADKFRALDGVDGAIRVVRGPVAVSNPAKGQTEPLVILVGPASEDLAGFERDFQLIDGTAVVPADLADDEVYANESAADELDIAAGDVLTVFVGGEPREFTVKDIVMDRVLTGALGGLTTGLLVNMPTAQALFGREDVDFIGISNDGGVRAGVKLSEEVTKQANLAALGTNVRANDTKKEFVDSAAETSSFLVTFFVILGLFSIAAGMLLIFLIFVMLAAERKVEMGMLRAVGTKRNHLVQVFLSEGMVYNVGAAAVGCALGIGAAVVMIQIMRQLFAELDLQITFYVTARSLIVSYAIGVVLTFLTVVFSSWRIGNLNIVSAIRDTADPVTKEERPRGGIFSYARWLLFKPSSLRGWLIMLATLGAALGAGIAGVALFFAAGALYGAGAVGGTLAVLSGVIGGFLIAGAVVAALIAINSTFQTGPVFVVAGPILMLLGLQSKQAFPFGGGVSLLIVGIALVIRYVGFPARPVFTTMGLVMLVLWLLMAGNNLPYMSELNGDIEMFFLSGVTMVLAGTFVLVYNADLLLGLLTFAGGFMSSLVPSIRTAVAYPLANKFRTGMTIAMISLVMFALVMMSTMNSNFDRIFLSEDALAGYDVVAQENPGNPIADLQAELRENAGRDNNTGPASDGNGGGSDGDASFIDAIAGVDKVRLANTSASEVGQVDELGETEFFSYEVKGLSPEFIANNELKFQSRATGLDSDEAVWRSLAENPNQAIIDSFAVQGGGFDDGGFSLEGIEVSDRTFDPVTIVVRDKATGALQSVQLIGVISTEGAGLYGGLLLNETTFDKVFPRPESTIHYVRVSEGADAAEVARGIERTLLFQGVQADSLRKIIDDFQAQSRGFLYLIQGFMGIGLFVGIAAVGVIAFRTVVERRQQIGMLRAIGYTRRAVALSFIMESSFTALLGITSGITLGLLLAYQLVNTDEFVPGGIDNFYIPWMQILFIGGFAFLASLVMTIIPSRQASSIPIAEALRYE